MVFARAANILIFAIFAKTTAYPMRKRNKDKVSVGVPPMAELPDPENISIPDILSLYDKGEVDLICVLGPTASGKTSYAVKLCHEINTLKGSPVAEIISADSRQVYRGMDIGTGKDLGEYGDIPYHLIDIAPAGSRYNIYEYQRDFEKAYRDIVSRGGVPVLCGGSGLYIEAATCGYILPELPADPEFRERLEKEDITVLRHRLLSEVADVSEGTLQSKRRIIRALEVAEYRKTHPVEDPSFLPKKVYFIGTLVSREERIRRIDLRLESRIEEGMIDEVRRLIEDEKIPPEDLIYYGLEYKFITQHVLGILSLEEMKTLLANAIHQFAKRQMTWFRGMENKGYRIHWVDPKSLDRE